MMETTETKKSDGNLPPYTLFPNTNETKKKWIVGVSLALLLALIVVASTLIGVYMTQKHTETMVTMALRSQDGHKAQQTILVNEQEDVAVFIVVINNSSSTILFDYKKRIIGIRTSNSTKCYLLKMDKVQTPSIPQILTVIRNFQKKNPPPSNKITYNVTPIKEATLADLGININILCSDVPIYWSEMMSSQKKQQRKVQEHEVITIRKPDGTVITIQL
ncbi:surfactant protein C-like isoform X2 [Pyxicephalus adspersus]|uniref:surfactant protein C-like isoform X2 n=1 Tax=Pyxicephalus adspersus TaxID=30357 RepID=UPI003B5AF13F